MYCTKCGSLIADDSKFCTNCGIATKNDTTQQFDNSTAVFSKEQAVASFVFGGLGSLYLLASNYKSINKSGKGHLIYPLGTAIWVVSVIIEEIASWKFAILVFICMATLVGYFAKEISLPKADVLDPIPYKERSWVSTILPIGIGFVLTFSAFFLIEKIMLDAQIIP